MGLGRAIGICPFCRVELFQPILRYQMTYAHRDVLFPADRICDEIRLPGRGSLGTRNGHLNTRSRHALKDPNRLTAGAIEPKRRQSRARSPVAVKVTP